MIGAGPGGYVAAIRAAELGMKTACIEKDARPGGVCLNVGCIPSKALLESTEHYSIAKNRLGEHGIRVEGVSIDLAALMERKEKIVSGLTENVRKLMEGQRRAADSGICAPEIRRGNRGARSGRDLCALRRRGASFLPPGASRSSSRFCRLTANGS